MADPLNRTLDDYLNPRSYLGYLVESKISKLKSEPPVLQTEELEWRQRCQYLLISLYNHLKQRVPDNLIVLKNVSIFSVANVLQPVKDLTKYCNVIEHLGISGNIFAKAESQLQGINLVK